MVAKFLDDNKPKTSLKKWICKRYIPVPRGYVINSPGTAPRAHAYSFGLSTGTDFCVRRPTSLIANQDVCRSRRWRCYVKFVLKRRGRWCEFLVTVEGHCRYDNCRRRKWSPRKCGKFMCCFTGTVKHVEGNMSSGNMYWILLSLLSVIVSAPHSNSPVTVKAATNFSDSE